MNPVLLGKEIRQHSVVFLALLLLNLAGAVLVGRALSASGASGSVLSGSCLALISLVSITAAVISHRLIAAEFQGRTNLFLEALPLPRWRMILTKLVVGWCVILASAAAVLFLPWFFAGSEIRTLRFLAILLSRALLWASFIYAFFFLTSFLGRYRVPLYLFLGFALLWLTSGSTSLRPAQIPPFALIDPNRFAFERELFPARDIVWTAGLSLGFFAGAFLLGLTKEGSVAAMLGERMSHRERLFFGGAFFLLISIPILVDHHRPQPFHLPGALEEESRGVRVLFSPEDLSQPVDRELVLAMCLTEALAEERDWLRIPASKWPPVFVVERTDLDSAGLPFEAGVLEKDEGCLVYADYRRASFPDRAFAHFVARQCLRVYSRDRIEREEKRWIFDGLQLVRELRAAPPETRQAWVQRASQALRDHPITAASLSGWDRFEDSAGEEPARALSWHLLQTLRDHAGEERFRRFVMAALGPPVPARDVRAVVWDRMHPVARVFTRTIGTSLPDFLALWKSRLVPNAAEPQVSPPASPPS